MIDDVQDALEPPKAPKYTGVFDEPPSDKPKYYGAFDDEFAAQAVNAANSQRDPRAAAKAAPIARQMGLPQAAVEANVDEFQRQATAQKNTQLLAEHPLVRQWVAENPAAARIAHEEYDKLSKIEKTWEGTKDLGYGTLQGLGGSFNALGLAGARVYNATESLFGYDDPHSRALVKMLEENQKVFSEGEGWFQKGGQIFGGLAGMLSQIVLLGGRGGPALPAAANVLTTIAHAVQTAVRAMFVPAVTAAVNTGTDIFQATGGDRLSTMKAAGVSAANTFAMGVVPLSAPAPAGFVGGMKRAFTGGVANAAQSEANRAAWNLIMPTELQRKFDPANFAVDVLQGMAMGAIMGPRLEPSWNAAIRQTYIDAANAETAQRDIGKILALSDIAQQSELRKADLEAFKGFVQMATDKSGLDAVYVDAATLSEALAQSQVDLATMPEVARQLEEAVATKGDVRIPVSDYAAHIAGSDLEGALLPKLKASPDGMTYAEGKAFFDNLVEEMTKRADTAIKAQGDQSKARTDADEIFKETEQKFINVGRMPAEAKVLATIHRAFVTTSAARAKMTVRDFANKYEFNATTDALGKAYTQPRFVDTIEFKVWSNDAPVVDARSSGDYEFKTGEKVAVEAFHGTPNGEVEFTARERGIWFTGSTDLAEGYTRGNFFRGGHAPAIYPAYLAMSNPLVIDALGKRNDNIPFPGQEWKPKVFGILPKGAVSIEEAYRRALEMGHDGLIVRNAVDTNSVRDRTKGTVYVVRDPGQIKSSFDDGLNQGAFYSPLERALGAMPTNAAPADGWKQAINGLISKGIVKRDEVEWSGVNEWLDMQPGKVTKQQVLDFVKAHGVQVTETALGNKAHFDQRQAELDRLSTELGAWLDAQGLPDRSADELLSEHRGGVLQLTDKQVEHLEEFSDNWDEVANEQDMSRLGQDDPTATKYGVYTLPGGENYREILLTLPQSLAGADIRQLSDGSWRIVSPDGSASFGATREQAVERYAAQQKGVSGYVSPHWDTPNVLAHIRVDDRTDAEGRRVLFVEEIQSDWGQAAKKHGTIGTGAQRAQRRDQAYQAARDALARNDDLGFDSHMHALTAIRQHQDWRDRWDVSDEDAATIEAYIRMPPLANTPRQVPAAPFVDKTDKWVALALKRIIKLAVDEGYDRVAFINGEQSAQRYSLDKQVDYVSWESKPTDGAARNVTIGLPHQNPLRLRVDGDGAVLAANGPGFMHYEGKPLDEVIGKDLADRILAEGSGRLSGDGLKLEAKGMRAFYDQIVPAVAKDVLKKLGGGQVGAIKFGSTAGWHLEKQESGLFAIIDPEGRLADMADTEQDGLNAIQHFAAGDNIGRGPIEGSVLTGEYPGFDITDTMRVRAADGLPLFQPPTGELVVDGSPEGGHKFKTGKPVTVRGFHGSSSANIAEEGFRADKLGSNTNAKSAREGFFFSGNPDTAERYAGEPSIAGPEQGLYANMDPTERNMVLDEAHYQATGKHLLDEYEGMGYKLKQNRDPNLKRYELYGPDGKHHGSFEEEYEAVDYLLTVDGPESIDFTEEKLFGDDQLVSQLWGGISGESLALPGSTPTIYPTRLHFNNPLVHDYKGEHYREQSYAKVIAEAKAAGHDGVILKNTYDGGPLDNIFVVFNEGQIEHSLFQGPRDVLNQKAVRADTPQLRALVDKISREGVTDPEDLRTLLSTPGYSQAARSDVLRNVDAAARLRAELGDKYGRTDWKVPKLNDQGVISLTADWARQGNLEELTALADKYGAPVVVRGHGEGGKSLLPLLEPRGFETYLGVTEVVGRSPGAFIQYIRPGGGITATTPLFQGPRDVLNQSPAALPEWSMEKAKGARVTDAVKKGAIALSPKASLTARNYEKLDAVFAKAPNPLVSAEAWRKFMSALVADSNVLGVPYNALKYAQSPEAVADYLKRLRPDQIESRRAGFALGAKIRQEYVGGRATPVTTGRLLLWAMLSRKAGAYPHEAAYMDLINAGVDKWIDKAARGDWSDTDGEDFAKWSSEFMATLKGGVSPGAGVTSNANDFGRILLTKMSRVDESGRSSLARLHDMLASESISTNKVRREFFSLGDSLGIQNKVLSFALLVTGRWDTLVLDRVQFTHLWGDTYRERALAAGAKPNSQGLVNIYDGEHGGLAPAGEGHFGIAIYEALARGMTDSVAKGYALAGMTGPGDGTLGAFHWDSWLIESSQAIGHPTIEALTTPRPRPSLAVRQGKFDTYSHNFEYRADGSYQIPLLGDGNYRLLTPAEAGQFQSRLSDPNEGVVPSGFRVSEHKAKPWVEAEGVNRDRYDAILSEYGRPAAAGDVAGLAAAAGRGSADGVRGAPAAGAGYNRGLSQEAAGAARGQIQFPNKAGRVDLGRGTSLISLLKDADLSTALHEFGHLYVEIYSDIASRADAPEEIKADLQALLNYGGIKDNATWRALTIGQKRDAHEKIAQAFEKYLWEGRAPSVELRPIFQRIRSWMVEVYRSLRGLNVELTTEVRQVFDRMLASEEAIAEASQKFPPLFKSAEDAGMTTEQFDAYMAMDKEHVEEAIDQLNARSLADLKWASRAKSLEMARLQRQAETLRRGIREQATQEVDALPAFRALEELRTVDPEFKAKLDAWVAARDAQKTKASETLAAAKRTAAAAMKDWDAANPEPAKPKKKDPQQLHDAWQVVHDAWAKARDAEKAAHDEALAEARTVSEAMMAKWRETNARPIRPRTPVDDWVDAREARAAEILAAEKARVVGDAKGIEKGQILARNKRAIDNEVERQMLGWEQANPRPKLKRNIPLDHIAEKHGFSSADHMLQSIMDAGDRRDVIDAMTDQRMLAQHGELTDPKAIEDAALEAIHNEARARFLATGLKSLTHSPLPVGQIARAARAAAEAAIARKRIADINPRTYLSAEAKNAKEAASTTDLGKRTEAQRASVLNNALAKASMRAQADVEKGIKYLGKVEDAHGIDVYYADQISALLERYDLSRTTRKALERRLSLRRFLDKLEEQGEKPNIPDALIDNAKTVHYKELSVEEFRGLVDAVKSLEHLGRFKNKLLLDKARREFKAIEADIVDSIEANAGGREANARQATTKWGKRIQSWDKFRWAHMKAAILARVIDGNKEGPLWRYVVKPANERGNFEVTMRAEATRQAAEILDPVTKGGDMQKARMFPSIGQSKTREEVFFMLANMGNEGNIQRMLSGEGWTLAQVLPVISSLDAATIRQVQKVWDHFESLKPLVAAKERRVYGKEPEWVEPAPIEVTASDGTRVKLKGGYFPIVYDSMANAKAEGHADAESAQRELKGAYTSATTRRGYVKTRAEEVNDRPIVYSASSYFGALNDVIHDLAWHEWLIDTNKILRSDKIDQSIRNTYGPWVTRQFKTWAKDIATGERGLQAELDGFLGKVRHGVSMAGLGFNAMSAVVQPLGLTQSIVRVGGQEGDGLKWVGKGIGEYIAHPIKSAREVNSMSTFMANRSRTRFREINELMGQIEGEHPLREWMGRYAYWMMMRAQQAVDVPTWIGAYQKAVSQGKLDDAVAIADQAVIDSQGGGQIKDLSGIERGGAPQKLFTVFYSFMNTAANIGALQTMTAKSRGKLAADYLMLYTVPAVLGTMLKDALTPGDSGDYDDTKSIARKMIAAQVDYLMGLMVLTREVSGAAKAALDLEDYTRDYSGPAGTRLFGDVTQAGKQVRQIWEGGDFDASFRKSMINLTGDLFGLPSAQANRTITGIEALKEGDTKNPFAIVFGYQK